MAGYKWLEIPIIYANIVKDKKQSANSYYRYFLARLSRMFEYKNLPDTIPHEMLDRYLMNNGIACITKVDGELYVFYGNLGGPQDVYYRPTEFIISNPHIRTESGELFTANVPINPSYAPCADATSEPLTQQGVLIRNDTEWIGLAPMLSRYSYLMAENILTLRTADVMLRITALLTAPSDKERMAAIEYLKSMEKGELGVIGESPFFDGVKLQSPPSNNGSYLTQFIEYQQYLKGSIFNELGLVANYNMKREAIGKGESTLDQDAIIPLADNMLLCRQEDMKRVNELYGTDITVQFSSAWLENQIETETTLIALTQPTMPFGAGGGSQNAPLQGDMGQNGADMGQNRANTGDNEDNENDMVEKEDKEDNGTQEPNDEPEEQSGEDNNGSEEPDEENGEEENEESKINDTASEGFLEEIAEKVEDKLENDTDNVALTQQEGEDDVDNSQGSSDSEENISDN